MTTEFREGVRNIVCRKRFFFLGLNEAKNIYWFYNDVFVCVHTCVCVCIKHFFLYSTSDQIFTRTFFISSVLESTSVSIFSVFFSSKRKTYGEIVENRKNMLNNFYELLKLNFRQNSSRVSETRRILSIVLYLKIGQKWRQFKANRVSHICRRCRGICLLRRYLNRNAVEIRR